MLLRYFTRLIFRTPNYVSAFGFWPGIRALLTVEYEWPQRSKIERSIRLPGLNHTIAVRKTIGDHSVIWQCLVRRQYSFSAFKHEKRVWQNYTHETKAGRKPLIIDGGANIGMATIWFAQTFADATVIAIEPDQDNFDLLTRNTAYYGSNVKTIHGGLWSCPGQLRITNPEAGAAGYQVAFCDQPESGGIEALTLPQLVAEHPDHFLFFVKLDIEGAQKDLFSENLDWISAVHVIAIELDDWKWPWTGSSIPVFKALAHYDFDYVLCGETLFCFRHVEPS